MLAAVTLCHAMSTATSCKQFRNVCLMEMGLDYSCFALVMNHLLTYDKHSLFSLFLLVSMAAGSAVVAGHFTGSEGQFAMCIFKNSDTILACSELIDCLQLSYLLVYPLAPCCLCQIRLVECTCIRHYLIV